MTTVRNLFSVTAVLTLMLGVVWTAVPQAMLASWGVQGDAVTVYMSRRYGALFFGYALILWMARTSEPSSVRRAILAGGTAATAIMAVLSLVGVLTGVVGPFVWSAVVIEVVLAASFGYLFATSS